MIAKFIYLLPAFERLPSLAVLGVYDSIGRCLLCSWEVLAFDPNVRTLFLSFSSIYIVKPFLSIVGSGGWNDSKNDRIIDD
jgi:hypothetical protein